MSDDEDELSLLGDEGEMQSPGAEGEYEEDQLDIDEFYDADAEAAGDYVAAYAEADGGYYYEGDDFYDAGSNPFGQPSVPDGFPPPLSTWEEDVAGTSTHPDVSFDQGKVFAWAQAQLEIEYLRDTRELV